MVYSICKQMAKSTEKYAAIKLRSEGQSIKYIAKQLNVSVGSVSIWCKNVVLTTEQIDNLQIQGKDPFYGKRLEYSQKRKAEVARLTSLLSSLGANDIGNVSKRELFLVGIALYWSEGFKKDKQVGFSNSEPEMIVLFIKWLTYCCKIPSRDIKIRIAINSSHMYRIDAVHQFWSKKTDIPLKNFQKPTFQNIVWKKLYENESTYHGVARIRVAKSTNLLRRILGSIQALKIVNIT